MGSKIIERQVKNAAEEALDGRTIRVLKGVQKIAAKQGGENSIENYKLLGKRAIIALGIVVVVAQASSAIGYVLIRKAEEQRIERIMRRVLEEERQKAQA